MRGKKITQGDHSSQKEGWRVRRGMIMIKDSMGFCKAFPKKTNHKDPPRTTKNHQELQRTTKSFREPP